MAKKKGRRSANVARKREKRNRNRKSRQKQLAIEKQRRLHHNEKSLEEEHLYACILQSSQLLDEPEFEGVAFDPQSVYEWLIESFNAYEEKVKLEDLLEEPEGADSTDFTEAVDETLLNHSEHPPIAGKDEEMFEQLRLEFLSQLTTQEFVNRLIQALKLCEPRLKSIGNQELAEVAAVTRSLFEEAPPEILIFHPMIQALGFKAIQGFAEKTKLIASDREEIAEVFSEALAVKDKDLEVAAPHISDSVSRCAEVIVDIETATVEKNSPNPTSASVELPAPPLRVPEGEVLTIRETIQSEGEGARQVLAEEASVQPVQLPAPETKATPTRSKLTPEDLPARALYKNFNGLALKEKFQGAIDEDKLGTYMLVRDDKEQIELADVENERYITVTEERLQLHARSEEELAAAIAEAEMYCGTTIMYLAKTVETEERG